MASRSKLVRTIFDNWPAKIVSLAVAVVVVLFNDLAGVGERYFSVPLELLLPPGYVPAAEHVSRVRVTLRGDNDEIFSVSEEDIVATADFRRHDVDGQFRATVEVAKVGTAVDVEPLEIDVEPPAVTVTLEAESLRSVEVIPNIVGFPPPGYELSDYRMSPTTVTIGGPRSRVESIDSLVTEVIELAGRRNDFSERVRIVRPDPLLTFPGGDVVEFRALIVETVVQRAYEQVEVAIVDLPAELVVVGALPVGTIRVQGKQIDLDGVPQSRISLLVDASSITAPGTYELPTRPQVPTGLVVLEVEPSRVELEVARATAPTRDRAAGSDGEGGAEEGE